MSKLINLTKGYQAIVDDDDFCALSKVKWYALVTKHGVYAVRDVKNKKTPRTTYLMHRVIANCPDDKVIDHINHNTLDNRRENLRVCSQSENCANTRKKSNGKTSPYKGVFYSKSHKKYRTRIMKNGKIIELGLFSNPEEASKVYNQAAKMHLGEFAYSSGVGRIAS